MFAVAVIGADGAGKTTVTKRLLETLPVRMKYLYMGWNPESSNFALPTSRLMLHLKLRELYRMLDAEAAHAFLVFGDGHAIPDLSSVCMLSWMDRWLKYDGDPLGAWDARPAPTE